MRLAISNIAWDVGEDTEIAGLLSEHGVAAIDIAPGKYFPDPPSATDAEIRAVKAWWVARGFEITGMQALLFGTSGLNVFGGPESQKKLLEHLRGVCHIGGRLGATRLVFGSPKNRDRGGMSDSETLDVAVPFFQRLGDIATSEGVQVCLEPNPTCYGANFMTNSADTASVVSLVGHEGIRMQLDTGAITINGEDVVSVLDAWHHLIGHIHASEPDLVPLGDDGTDHDAVHAALRRYLPQHVVSIEMVATLKEAHASSIDRAVRFATRHYDSPHAGARK